MREADEILLGFTRALRAAGVAVNHDRAQQYLAAVALLGMTADAARAAGKATLCAGPDDLVRYEEVFTAYFDHRTTLLQLQADTPPNDVRCDLPLGDASGVGEGDSEPDIVRALASDADVLRYRDVATLSPAEKARATALFATLRPRAPTRRSARNVSSYRGEVDAAATLRATLRHMGEPAQIVYRRRTRRPRRVVLLIDVSGSMAGYADALLRLAHRFTQAMPGKVNSFALGTRLTHLTAALRHRDPERALVAVGEAVPDWSGGTRLGENLQSFLTVWGRRGLARGAVVVICSDGWERGDTRLLSEQMAQLRRVAHCVIWVNPHRGKPGYEPVQQGVVAVLPHTDAYVAGHSLATYAELIALVAQA